MTTEHERRGALEAIDRIVNRGGEAAAIFPAAERALSPLFDYVSIAPRGAAPVPDGAMTFAIGRNLVLVVTAPADADVPLLERAALLLSAYDAKP